MNADGLLMGALRTAPSVLEEGRTLAQEGNLRGNLGAVGACATSPPGYRQPGGQARWTLSTGSLFSPEVELQQKGLTVDIQGTSYLERIPGAGCQGDDGIF